MSQVEDLARVPVAVAHMLTEDGSAGLSVYLPRPDGRNAVLYCATDGKSQRPDYGALKESGVNYLLVRNSETGACERFVEDNLAELLQDPAIEPAGKADCIQYIGSSMARDLSDGVERDESRLELTELEMAEHFRDVEFQCGQRSDLNLARPARLIDVVIDGILADPAVAAHLLQVSGHHRSTASHLFSVAALAIILGVDVVGPDEDGLRELGLAGLLHDLGKVMIDPQVLDKEAPLTSREVHLIQHHPIESVRLIGDDPHVTPAVREMILQHHERLDGRGYPLGLSGSHISGGARILSIVDSFHALTARRSYRVALTPREAVRVMRCQVGKQFDPDVFGAWEKLFERCWRDYPRTMTPSDDAPCERVSYHRDHYSASRRHKTLRGRTRLPCHGRAKVRWLYSGKLLEPESSDQYTSLLFDLSARGACMFTDHPMYRGEVLSLCVEADGTKIWVRAIVRWCRRDPADRQFMTGVEFLQKISEDEALSKMPVKGMDDHELFPGT